MTGINRSDHAKAHAAHTVPLWALFMALLVLTAAEVVLYDLWVHYHFVSKVVIVMLILAFTLPKAGIVMTYFMHLKYEKMLIVILAVIPFFVACGAVLTILSDTVTLKPAAFNKVDRIGVYQAADHGQGSADDHSPHPDTHTESPSPSQAD